MTDQPLSPAAAAGSLELYCLLNADELRRFRAKADQAFADCIYKNNELLAIAIELEGQ